MHLLPVGISELPRGCVCVRLFDDAYVVLPVTCTCYVVFFVPPTRAHVTYMDMDMVVTWLLAVASAGSFLDLVPRRCAPHEASSIKHNKFL